MGEHCDDDAADASWARWAAPVTTVSVWRRDAETFATWLSPAPAVASVTGSAKLTAPGAAPPRPSVPLVWLAKTLPADLATENCGGTRHCVVLLGQSLLPPNVTAKGDWLRCAWSHPGRRWHVLSKARPVSLKLDYVMTCPDPPVAALSATATTNEALTTGSFPVAVTVVELEKGGRSPRADLDDGVSSDETSFAWEAASTATVVVLASPAAESTTAASQRKSLPHAICAVTIVRNEAPFLQEYFTYHSRLGVELFVVFDNNSTDTTLTVLEMNRALGVHHIAWPYRKSQAPAYLAAYIATRPLCEYTLFMDMDQFITLGPARPYHDTSLLEVFRNASVANVNGTVAQVCLHSKAFHSSGLVRRPKSGVVDSYRRARPALEQNPNCAVRPVTLKLDARIHWFMMPPNNTRVVLDPATAVFNHYKEKSWEDYLRKFEGRIGLVKDWVVPKNLSLERAPPDWGAGPDVVDVSVIRFRDRLLGRRCAGSSG